jgi:DNA-binding transcriptional ArsR family regulator
MDAQQRTPADARALKALAHPMRLEILSILNERVASPNGLAQELHAPVGVVAYHVRYLRDLEAIELVDTRPRRGATEHFYRAKMRPWFTDEEFEGLPSRTRRSIQATTVRRVVDDAVAALGHGGFDDATSHASLHRLELDGPGYEELCELLAATVERLGELEAESAARAGDDGVVPEAVEVALLGFRPPPRAGGRAKRRGR